MRIVQKLARVFSRKSGSSFIQSQRRIEGAVRHVIEALEGRRYLDDGPFFVGQWLNANPTIWTQGNEGWTYTTDYGDGSPTEDNTGWDGTSDPYTDHVDLSLSHFYTQPATLTVTDHWTADWYPDQTFDDVAYSADILDAQPTATMSSEIDLSNNTIAVQMLDQYNPTGADLHYSYSITGVPGLATSYEDASDSSEMTFPYTPGMVVLGSIWDPSEEKSDYSTLNIRPTINFPDGGTDPTKVTIAWADVEGNQAAWRLERSTDGTNYTLLTSVSNEIINYPDTDVTPGQTYWYKLRGAGADGGDTAYSFKKKIAVPLAAPPDPSVSIDDAGNVSVDEGDDPNLATGYKVFRSTTSDGDGTLVGTVDADNPSFTDTTADDGKTYYYYIEAVNADSDLTSPDSDRVSVTTPISPPDDLSATSTVAGRVDLSWTDNSNGETGYQIQRFDPDATSWTTLPTQAAGSHSYQDSGLDQGATYRYRIKALGSDANSSWSGTIQAQPTFGVPDAPSDLQVIDRNTNYVTLKWADNSENEAGFAIFHTSNGTDYSQVGWVPADQTTFTAVSSPTWTDTEQYKVQAFNAAGTSAFSDTCHAYRLAAPSNFSVETLGPWDFNLSWHDNSVGEDSFLIQMQTYLGAWTTIFTAAANATHYYSPWSLRNYTGYTLRVVASRGGVQSAPSNVATWTAPDDDPAGRYETLGSLSIGTVSYPSQWPPSLAYFANGALIPQGLYSIAVASGTFTETDTDEEYFIRVPTYVGGEELGEDPSVPINGYKTDREGFGVNDANGATIAIQSAVPNYGSVGYFGSVTVNLQQDSPAIGFTGDTTVAEGQSATVYLSRRTDQTIDTPVTAYFTISGSASALDVTGLADGIPGYDQVYSVEIPAGDMQAAITLPVVKDDLTEGPEDLTISLLGDEHYWVYQTGIGSFPTATIHIADADAVNLIAHRTGGKFGQEVSDETENSADPSQVLMLVNDDQDPGEGEPTYGSLNPNDDDLMRVTLKQIPLSYNSGTIALEKSDDTHVSPDGFAMTLTSNPNPNNPANALYFGDVDVWIAGVAKDPDFKLSLVWRNASNQIIGRDDVHFTIADLGFADENGDDTDSVMTVSLPDFTDSDGNIASDWVPPTGTQFRVRAEGITAATDVVVDSDEGESYTDQIVNGLSDNSGIVLDDVGEDGARNQLDNINSLAGSLVTARLITDYDIQRRTLDAVTVGLVFYDMVDIAQDKGEADTGSAEGLEQIDPTRSPAEAAFGDYLADQFGAAPTSPSPSGNVIADSPVYAHADLGPSQSDKGPITLVAALSGGKLNVGEIARLQLTDAEVSTIINSATGGEIGPVWTAADIQNGTGYWDRIAKEEADKQYPILADWLKYQTYAKVHNTARAKEILLLRNPSFQQYTADIYQQLRALNPVHFLAEKSVVVATGQEPVLGTKQNRLWAFGEVVLYVATLKGAQYAGGLLGKLKGAYFAPEAAATDGAVVFQSGGRFSMLEFPDPTLNPTPEEIDAALTAAEGGVEISMKPPIPPRSPAGGTADTLVKSAGQELPFDIYTPTSPSPNNVFMGVVGKNNQCQGVLLDLRATTVKLSDLGDLMTDLANEGANNIQEVIVIQSGGIVTRVHR